MTKVEARYSMIRILAFFILFFVGAMLFPASAGDGQEKPAEEPKKEAHHFWDRTNIIGLGVHAAARSADVHSTCRMLKRGFEEKRLRPLGIHSCGEIAVWSYSMVGAELGLRYWLHRKGHHKWERWLPYIFATPAGIEAGFNYRF